MTSSLFIATPVHDGRVHIQYMAGCLQAMVAFADRIAIDTFKTSFLPIGRDVLTARFLDSAATHMLCVDSDIGWTPADAQKLLDAGKDFVSGCYCRKQSSRDIPAELTGNREGDLLEASTVPAGFLLLSRAAVERMVGAYRHLQYKNAWGQAWALWSPMFEHGAQFGEDTSFCLRWRGLGQKIWMHSGVILQHIGECSYVPDAPGGAKA